MDVQGTARHEEHHNSRHKVDSTYKDTFVLNLSRGRAGWQCKSTVVSPLELGQPSRHRAARLTSNGQTCLGDFCILTMLALKEVIHHVALSLEVHHQRRECSETL